MAATWKGEDCMPGAGGSNDARAHLVPNGSSHKSPTAVAAVVADSTCRMCSSQAQQTGPHILHCASMHTT
jgi:hypothetical protein